MKIFPPEYSAVCEAFIELHRNNHTIHLLYDSFIVHNALGLEGQVMAERISWGAHKPTEGTYTGQWSETHHRPQGLSTMNVTQSTRLRVGYHIQANGRMDPPMALEQYTIRAAP